MFPLHTRIFPATADELAILLNGAIGRIFSCQSTPVSVSGDEYPRLENIFVRLDGARLLPDPPPPPAPAGTGQPGVQTETLSIRGDDISLGPASVDLRLEARHVHLHHASDKDGDLVLLLHTAAGGRIEVAAMRSEIENAIATIASREAAAHGVTIDQVALSVRQRGARSVDADVQLRARKLFFSTVIRITAKLDIDEELNASISGLGCSGDGAIGSLACGFLQPHLQQINGRSFPLMALPLGEIRLRDIQIEAGDRLRVSAEFGTATSPTDRNQTA